MCQSVSSGVARGTKYVKKDIYKKKYKDDVKKKNTSEPFASSLLPRLLLWDHVYTKIFIIPLGLDSLSLSCLNCQLASVKFHTLLVRLGMPCLHIADWDL